MGHYKNLFLSRIEKIEDQALQLGDLVTAIKLNWIRNAVRFGDIDLDTAAYRLMAVTILGNYGEKILS